MQTPVDRLYMLAGALADIVFQRRKALGAIEGEGRRAAALVDRQFWEGDDLWYLDETLRECLARDGWSPPDIDRATEIRMAELDQGIEERWGEDWRELWRPGQPSAFALHRSERRAMGVTE